MTCECWLSLESIYSPNAATVKGFRILKSNSYYYEAQNLSCIGYEDDQLQRLCVQVLRYRYSYLVLMATPNKHRNHYIPLRSTTTNHDFTYL